MEETNIVTAAYHVPTYQLEPNEVWFHFLHGNVPGHQIDFMYRPDVPQPPLTRQHFSHLARVVKYIEPRHANAYSFAITNLSRDDNQYEPGHGGIAFVFGLRIKGATDHAGRQDPPFCHSAVLIDRHLDFHTLHGIAVQFYEKLLPDEESQVEGSGWYHQYVRYAEHPGSLEALLRAYLQDFADLYVPPPSRHTLRWSVDGATVPRRVTIVYPDRADFSAIAYWMARIGEVLIESNVKWTAISNGREQDVPGGLTVRFVPRRDASDQPAPDEALLWVEHLSEDPAEIAAQLFNAHDVMQDARASRLPPAPHYGALRAHGHVNGTANGSANGMAEPTAHAGAMGHGAVEERARPWARPEPEPIVATEDPALRTQGLGIVAVVEKKDSTEPLAAATDWATEFKKNERKQRKQAATALVATALFILVFGGLAVVWVVSEPTLPEEATDASATAVKSAAAAPWPAASPTPTPTVTTPPMASGAASGTATNASSAPTMALPPATIQFKPTGKPKKTPTKKENPFDQF